MSVIAALPGETSWALQLARITAMTEHSTRVQRPPSLSQLHRERKKREQFARLHLDKIPNPNTLALDRPRSPSRGAARLTEAEVKTLRVFFATHPVRRSTVRLKAHEYGISMRAMYDIKNGHSWPHICADEAGRPTATRPSGDLGEIERSASSARSLLTLMEAI